MTDNNLYYQVAACTQLATLVNAVRFMRGDFRYPTMEENGEATRYYNGCVDMELGNKASPVAPDSLGGTTITVYDSAGEPFSTITAEDLNNPAQAEGKIAGWWSALKPIVHSRTGCVRLELMTRCYQEEITQMDKLLS